MSIPKQCKRLAEVDFPLAKVGKHALAEKARRMGTPHQIHFWWAWRPLAACRAMLMGLLLPDPADPQCPAKFKDDARGILRRFSSRELTNGRELRDALLSFVADFANWELANTSNYIDASRSLIRSAWKGDVPVVADTFSGGGSIPLEAIRLGCEAYASDLNPVACLVSRVKLEEIPRSDENLVDDLHSIGALVQRRATEKLKDYFPPGPDGSERIAYLWARTVVCESPNCGAEIPVTRTFWLCKKAGRRRALRYSIERKANKPPRVVLEVFHPKNEAEVARGTVSRAKATCPCCGNALAPDRVRVQLIAQQGGCNVLFDNQGRRIGGAMLLAVVVLSRGQQGREYQLPAESDYLAIWKASKAVDGLPDVSDGVAAIPNEPLPTMSGTFNAPLYGMNEWGKLFTRRQQLALHVLTSEVRALSSEGTPPAVRTLLGMVCSKLADRSNAVVNWGLSVECPTNLFKGNAIPMGWDFCESNILCDSSASFEQGVMSMCRNVASAIIPSANPSAPTLADARDVPLPDGSVNAWFVDPPYYFAVPYADLSDFFFVWLKRALPEQPLLRDPFDLKNRLTPKDRELCEMARWDRVRYPHKTKEFFEDGMRDAFLEGRRILGEDGVGCIVFAHKTTEGWEALISGIIRAGLVVTSSWPIATERSARMRARDSAALETSVHLVCRPRPDDAVVGDWGDVLRELPVRVRDWMERLQDEGVRGADLVFACVGPALEVFSRYSRVETAEGTEVGLDTYLLKVWEVVGRAALERVLGTAEANARNGSSGALEEDSRLTALFLWTLQATGGNGALSGDEPLDDEGSDEDDDASSTATSQSGFALVFDVVRRFAQPLGVHLDEWESRIIRTEKGIVRLIPVLERAAQLFGEDGASLAADRIESAPTGPLQLSLFPSAAEAAPQPVRSRRRRGDSSVSDRNLQTQRGATTLDRVHAAMLLQALGRSNALRALLKDEVDRGPDFVRLANALSALYPTGSDEKRLVDAMLLAVPR